jgi:putative ABC transport system permease protein
VLIVGEIALSLVLLVGSGLMIRSVARLYATSSGMNTEGLFLTVSDGGRDFSSAMTWWRSALERAREFPGVESASLTSRPPVHGARRQAFEIDGRTDMASMADNEAVRAGDILISGDYFQTTGIPLVRGRAFSEHDTHASAPVAIISQSLARQYFPGVDPIGRRIMLRERAPLGCCSTPGPVQGVWREIVGVAADVRQGGLDQPLAMTVYRPYTQIVEHDMYLLVRARSGADAARIAKELGQHLRGLDPARIWSDVRRMSDVIDGSDSIRIRRFVLILLAGFAGLALILAAVGTYGVMAQGVAERTREIGIRVALGATREIVLRDVIGSALRITLIGLAVGMVGAYASTRLLTTLLFDVSATDGVTYAVVACLLTIVALLAAVVPARRALRIDPLVALRQE